VLIAGATGPARRTTLRALLPQAFAL